MRTAMKVLIAAVLGTALAGPVLADDTKSIAIIVMNDTPQLLEVKEGLLKGLAKHGYVEGKNLKVDFKSAQGNFGTAQQIVRQFVGERPDVIVPITTPTSQAAAAATKDIPIVFSTVTDPVAAKIVPSNKHPGGNASGVTDVVPIERQLAVVKQLVPNLKTLGLLYDPSLDNARSTVEQVKKVAPTMGFTTVESGAMGLNNVPAAAQALVGKADAIFVPNDTTVYGAFESVVKVGQDAKVPVFTAERRSVQRGAVATVGFDFVQMGLVTADMVDKVLKGAKPGDLDVVRMEDVPDSLGLYINKASAEKMGVKVPPELLAKAAHVF
ncbi:MAG TPA: ABC transporter substrate-binding protein [Pseudolabrys sp.]|nr:ABC transporter substrate-binding protein [Pseudolabrys sp.]